MRQDGGRQSPGGAALEAATLRKHAQALESELEQLERHDWPGWLRCGGMITQRITELKRQAAMLEGDARRVHD